jgi:hypoxanthine phosphoribosyltransferase
MHLGPDCRALVISDTEKYLRIGPATTYKLTEKLYSKLQPYPYDTLIIIPAGGFIPARYWIDLCRRDQKKIEFDTFHIETYTGEFKKPLEPVIKLPPRINLNGRMILLFDDVVDSGRTPRKAMEYVMKQNPNDLRFAALFWKIAENIQPDFYVERIRKEWWIIFHGEDFEDSMKMCKVWIKSGIESNEMKRRLKELGYNDREIYNALYNASRIT